MTMNEFRVAPFISWGMWVALCPRGCGNAEKRGRCDDGTIGGLEAERFTCRRSHHGCGFQCAVDWPSNIADIEALVLARPRVSSQNWTPGETLHDLLRENIRNGIVPNDELEIGGDKITAGNLTSWRRAEIGE